MRFFNLFFTIFIYFFIYLPVFVLVFFSFNQGSFLASWSGFTFEWYRVLWYESGFLWSSLYNSLFIAFFSTFFSLFMGLVLIFFVMRNSSVRKYLNIFYLNLIVPEIVLAVGLLSFFVFFSIPLGKLSLILAHTILGLGYCVPILSMKYESLDSRIVEASLDLGATRLQTFVKIIFPLLIPALFVTGLLVFIISFDEFILSYFCSGATSLTLPLYILSMLRVGISSEINALSTCLLVVSSFLLLIFLSLARAIKNIY